MGTGEKIILSAMCLLSGLIVLFVTYTFNEQDNCIDENGHKWRKWEVIGRRVLYDNSAVHERTCNKCGWKEIEG